MASFKDYLDSQNKQSTDQGPFVKPVDFSVNDTKETIQAPAFGQRQSFPDTALPTTFNQGFLEDGKFVTKTITPGSGTISQGKIGALEGFVDSITDWDREDVPYSGSFIESADLVKVAIASNRFEKGVKTEEDAKLINDYYTKIKTEEKLRENKGYAIGEGVKTSARFMGELAIIAVTEIFTGGVAPTGDAYVIAQVAKMGAKKTVEKLIKDKVFRASVSKVVKNKLKQEAKLIAKQFVITAPTNVTGSAAERMIGSYNLETGEVIDPGQEIGEATVNGLSQHAVELITERGGGVSGKILGTLTAPVKKVVVKTALYQALSKAIPKATNPQLVALINKTGWNGIVGEWFEERDADILNNALEAVGLGDQDFTGLTLDEMTTELAVIAISAGAIKGAVYTSNKTSDILTQKAKDYVGEGATEEEAKSKAEQGGFIKFGKDSEELSDEEKLKEVQRVFSEQAAKSVDQKITEQIRHYQDGGGRSVGTETASPFLRDINELIQTPEGEARARGDLAKAIESGELLQNDNGSITLYRVGEIGTKNPLFSATYNKEFSQEFSDAAKAKITQFEVKPEEIKVFIGGVESEVLLAETDRGLVKVTKQTIEKEAEKMLSGIDITKEKFELDAKEFISNRMKKLDISSDSFSLNSVEAGGSRVGGNPRTDSDLDARVYYDGTMSEDKVHDILVDINWETGETLSGDGEMQGYKDESGDYVNIDIEPIKDAFKTKPLNPKDYKFGEITTDDADGFIGKTFTESTKGLSEGNEGVVIKGERELEVVSRRGNDFIVKDTTTGKEEDFDASLFIRNFKGGTTKEILGVQSKVEDKGGVIQIDKGQPKEEVATKEVKPVDSTPKVKKPRRKAPNKFEKQALGIPADEVVTRKEKSLLKTTFRKVSKFAKKSFQAGKTEKRIELTKKFKKQKAALTEKQKIRRDAMNEKFRNRKAEIISEQKASRDAIVEQLKTKAKDISKIKNNIIAYIKNVKNIPESESGRFLGLVNATKTQKQLAKAFARIDVAAEKLIRKELKKKILKKASTLMDSKNIAVDYIDRIKEVMAGLQLKGKSFKAMAKLSSTVEYIDKEEAKGKDVEMPKKIIESLSILFKTPFENITTKQLRGTLDELDRLAWLGKTKLKSRKALYEYEKGKIMEELIAGSSKLETIKEFEEKVGQPKLTLTKKFKNFLIRRINRAAMIERSLLPFDVVFDMVDGGYGLYDGANFRLIKTRFDYKFGTYVTIANELKEQVVDLMVENNIKEDQLKRIGFVAAREQVGGREKLANLNYTEKEIDAVNLTAKEQEVLDKIREIQNKLFPELEKTMREVFNIKIKKVENYLSFFTDYEAMDKAGNKFEDFSVDQRFAKMQEFEYKKKNVGKKFSVSRKGAGSQKIQLNAYEIFSRHIDDVVYLNTMGRDTKMIGEIVNSQEYINAAGDVGQTLISEWIDLIARKGGVAGAQQLAWLDFIRRNIGVGILGLKLSSMSVQLATIFEGFGMTGSIYGMKGFKDYATSKEWRQFLTQFPELVERAGGETAIQELASGNTWSKIQNQGFIGLKVLDAIAANSVATAAYQQKMSQLGEEIDLSGKPNKEAMDYAQLVVRRTQSSAQWKDVPGAISMGKLTGNRSIDRSLLQFQNFILTRYSRIRYDAISVGIKTRDPLKAANDLFWIGIAIMIGSGIKTAAKKALYLPVKLLTGKDDDDDDALKRSLINETLGSVPFVGNVFGMVMYGGEPAPVLDNFKKWLKSPNLMITGKQANTRRRAFIEFVTSSMILGGVPGALQLQQLLKDFFVDKSGSGSSKSSGSTRKERMEKLRNKSSSVTPKKKLALEDLIANMLKKA